ncbi:DUF2500 domain-containing protein [Paenibacillus senegalensis]|uniref:DUF2500 domain-containing protein n=1 Tax=Paenibacillus senegalensis TaxID=1465766 RepID=UPI00028990C6|nr:DUF2500 domain-containing protein [Paenibacillus senegalensis]
MFEFSPSPFGGSGSFQFMFTLVPIIIVIGFALVIFGLVKNGARYLRNSTSPVESHYATVIAKRMDVRHYSHHHGETSHPHSSSRTFYYITLEFSNGERREYLDKKQLYGLLIEGDRGYAEVQGDWIVSFTRQ